MFGIFNLNEGLDEVNTVRLSDQPFASDCEATFYQRNSCDLCRTHQYVCSGPDDVCERCAASSTPCTYTLSSGKGPGKKRLRKTSMAHPGLRAARAYYSPKRDSSNSSINLQQRPCTPQRDPRGEPTAAGQNSESPTADSGAWSFLNEMQYSPGGLTPAVDLSLGLQLPRPTSDAGVAGTSSSGLQQLLVEPGAGPLPLYDHPSSPIGGGEYARSSFLPEAAEATPCTCMGTMLELLEIIWACIGGREEEATENLFKCLDRSGERCRELLRCSNCCILARNPSVVAMLSRQLLAVANELSHRLVGYDQLGLHPAAPTFQWGDYTVQDPEINERLLQTLVCCYIDGARKLLNQLNS